MHRRFLQISIVLGVTALFGCSRKFESSSLFQVSPEGSSPSAMIEKFGKEDPTLSFSEVKYTDLIKASLKGTDARQVAQEVNDGVEKLQKEFKLENPKGTFIIWEKAEPASIGTYW